MQKELVECESMDDDLFQMEGMSPTPDIIYQTVGEISVQLIGVIRTLVLELIAQNNIHDAAQLLSGFQGSRPFEMDFLGDILKNIECPPDLR